MFPTNLSGFIPFQTPITIGVTKNTYTVFIENILPDKAHLRAGDGSPIY